MQLIYCDELKFKKRHLIHACRTCVLAILCLFFALAPSALGQQAERVLLLEGFETLGNSKTRDAVIRRSSGLKIGDRVTPERIERAWANLNATQFFKQVEVYPKPGSEKGKVVLVVEVEERKWPYFQFEGGHSDLDGWYFVPASVRFDNMLGRGQHIGLQFYLTARTQQIVAGYHHPALFDDTIFLDMRLYGGSREYIHYIAGEQALQLTEMGGINMKIGGKSGLAKFLTLGLRTDNYRPSEDVNFAEADSLVPLPLLPPALSQFAGDNSISAFYVGVHVDTRDDATYPERGFWGGIIAEKASMEINSDSKFNRFIFDARIYQAVYGHAVVAAGIKAGRVTDRTPYFERFYLGGTNTLRGYAEHRLTPIGHGTRQLLSNVELRFPLKAAATRPDNIFATLFWDSGGLWQENEKVRARDLFQSWGLGLRFRLPVFGLTRIDFAFPQTTIDESDFAVHVSLGQMF